MRELLFIVVVLIGCQPEKGGTGQHRSDAAGQAESPTSRSDSILQEAVEFYGMDWMNYHITFDFRDYHYTADLDHGQFTYQREFEQGGSRIRDMLTNNSSFRRFVDGERVQLPEKEAKAYTNSVSGVWYFVLLPYKLLDPAVVSEYQGIKKIAGKDYHQIGIGFKPEGLEKTHDDEYCYWFSTDSLYMDMFAYSYESEGVGMRFRRVLDRYRYEGILFQDYINYKPAQKVPLDSLPHYWESGKLEEVSRIEQENMRVMKIEAHRNTMY